jgi:REP-associated tyrosine transposase
MSDESYLFHRRSIRLRGRDYSADGAYFVTLATANHEPLFGQAVDGRVSLSVFGTVVADTWRWLPEQYAHVALDEWCVMPDHLHGILVLGCATGVASATTDGVRAALRRKPVGGLIGAFKTVSTKQINRLRDTPGAVVWQRDFWDYVIRDQTDLNRVRIYIRENARTLSGQCRGGS